MRSIYIFIILVLFTGSVSSNLEAQQTSPAPADNSIDQKDQPEDSVKEFQILRGPSLRMIQTDTGTLQIIAGGGLVRHEGTLFSADSMVMNNDTRFLVSYGNVHINDGDTVNIYSQYLQYDGLKRKSLLKKDVRLIGKNGTLYTKTLDYDFNSAIGNYYDHGKIINKENTVTSESGTYYADTRDVYFKKDVIMDSPQDTILADSLIYNMEDGAITLITESFIKNKEAEIRTTEGRYDTNTGDAFFSARTNVKDSSGRIYTANNMAMDGKTRNSQLEGNAVIIDSANGFNLIADQIFVNNKNNSFLATKKPLLIIKEKEDSTYMAADTIFTGLAAMVDNELIYPTDTATALSRQQSKLIHELRFGKSSDTDNADTGPDSTNNSEIPLSSEGLSDRFSIIAVLHTGEKAPTLKYQRSTDTSPGLSALPEKSVPEAEGTAVKPEAEVIRSNLEIKKFEDPATTVDTANSAPEDIKPVVAKSTSKTDSIVGQKDSTRYFIAYHHVKIFNDSLQSICDSLFITSADSVFRLYGSPLVWKDETQLSADTMFMLTRNKEAERLYAFNNSLVINKTPEGFFNQLKGNTLDIFFQDNKFDSLRLRGSQAESIYYLQEDDSSYIGIERATFDVIDMLFKNGELEKIKRINQIKGKMYPMGKIPDDQKRLQGFSWQEEQRPRSKIDLFH